MQKERNKYNRSFARTLTRWVLLLLLAMMGVMTYATYHLSNEVMIASNADALFSSIRSYEYSIQGAMSDISLAVENHILDIEQNIDQPARLQVIMERIVALNPRVRSCGISFVENYFPQKGRAYCPYAWRNDSLEVEGRPLEGAQATYLDSDWFKNAVAADSAHWSEPFFNSLDGSTPLVAYLHPVHDRKGRLVAILGADLSLLFMTQMVKELEKTVNERNISSLLDKEASICYVLTRDGTYITHPDQRRILKGNFFVHIKDADQKGTAQQLIEKMGKGETSHDETDYVVRVNRIKTYLFFTPLDGTDWNFVVRVPIIALNIPATVISTAMLIIAIIILMLTLFTCQLAIRRASLPLRQLAATADQMAGGKIDAALPHIKSHDEIHLLRDTFENMQHSLTAYIAELQSATAAKASIESELKIAHDIQMSMLPKTYPAFPERHDIDIYGMVRPAKAVGGDLYDFFIHDSKLLFCIGDVSGKGVPASLVMAVTCSLFRNIASYTQEPDKIMMALNDALCLHNETGMFVTLLVGVLHLDTGLVGFSNAGHNPPLLLSGGKATFVRCDANIPAGVMTGWQFTAQQLQLHASDSLFLYTDGLNEAEDINLQQFGMDRMQQVASASEPLPKALVEAMTTAVEQFAGAAEQNDDLTMLAIQYTQP